MKALKRMKKTFRSFLVFAMAFLVATSSLATAFASYGSLFAEPPEQQTVTVEHIWVDNGNQNNTRPDDVQADVTASTVKPGTSDKSETTNVVQVDKDGNETGTTKPIVVDRTENINFSEVGTDEKAQPSDTINDKGYDKGEADKDEAGKDDVDEDEAGKDDVGKDDVDKDEAGKDEAGKDDVDKDEAGKDDVDEGEADKDDVNNDNTEEPKSDWSISLDEIEDQDVKDAIETVLGTGSNGTDPIVKDLSGDDVDKITGELLDKPATKDENGNVTEPAVKDQGNVWTVSKDYTAETGENEHVTYQVKLPEDTQSALQNSGYDSVQLKVTYETVFAVKDDTGAV